MVPTCEPLVRECVFSPCRNYRYTLWRQWLPDLLGAVPMADDSYAMFVGLNPTTIPRSGVAWISLPAGDSGPFA